MWGGLHPQRFLSPLLSGRPPPGPGVAAAAGQTLPTLSPHLEQRWHVGFGKVKTKQQDGKQGSPRAKWRCHCRVSGVRAPSAQTFAGLWDGGDEVVLVLWGLLGQSHGEGAAIGERTSQQTSLWANRC